MAVAFITIVPEVVSAPDPINVFRSLVVFKDCPALVPTAVLFPPEVLKPRASCPRARFSLPETFLDKLSYPKAVLKLPVVFEDNALDPTATF